MGFEVGADDYITKPFSPRKLVERINAILGQADSERPIERLARAHPGGCYHPPACVLVRVAVPIPGRGLRLLAARLEPPRAGPPRPRSARSAGASWGTVLERRSEAVAPRGVVGAADRGIPEPRLALPPDLVDSAGGSPTTTRAGSVRRSRPPAALKAR